MESALLQHISSACPAFLSACFYCKVSEGEGRQGGSLWHEVKESRKQTDGEERSRSFENRRETTTSGAAGYIGVQTIKRYEPFIDNHKQGRKCQEQIILLMSVNINDIKSQ